MNPSWKCDFCGIRPGIFPSWGIGKRKIAFGEEVFGLHLTKIWALEVVLGRRKSRSKSKISPENRLKNVMLNKNPLNDDLTRWPVRSLRTSDWACRRVHWFIQSKTFISNNCGPGDELRMRNNLGIYLLGSRGPFRWIYYRSVLHSSTLNVSLP